MSVTHVYKGWLILPNLTHLAKRDPFCPVWLIVPSATIAMSVTHVYKVWLILPSLPIWPNVTHFAHCDSYLQVQ